MHSNMPDRENKTKTTIQVFDYVIKITKLLPFEISQS